MRRASRFFAMEREGGLVYVLEYEDGVMMVRAFMDGFEKE